MELQFTRYEKNDRLAIVTIDRPSVLNALSPDAHRELSAIWDDFQADKDLWVAILTGAGDRAFCVGSDLKWMAANPGEPFWVFHGGAMGFGGLCDRVDLHKPVIAAVNGLALGGGMVLALACDLIVAASDAEFGLPEARVGFTAGYGGIERLVRQIPEKLAMELILLGDRVSAEEAYRMGLVNRVVPNEDVMPTAVWLARRILEASPLALRADKQIAQRAYDTPLVVASNRVHSAMIELWGSQDYSEGARAFAERRRPEWKAQ